MYIIYFVGIVGDLNPLDLPYILFVAKLFILLPSMPFLPSSCLLQREGSLVLQTCSWSQKAREKAESEKICHGIVYGGAHMLGFLTRNLSTIKISDVANCCFVLSLNIFL